MNAAEIAKEILIATLDKGYFQSLAAAGRTANETNQATAEALGANYKIIFNAVQDAIAGRSSSHL